MRNGTRPKTGRRGRWAGVAAAAGSLAAGVLGAQAVRVRDQRRAEAIWVCLSGLGTARPTRFAPHLVDGLPEPARRYFRFAIAPGTALRTVAEIHMAGRFGLGDQRQPRYMPMRAREILAPPHGFVWIASIGSGLMRISGADVFADGEAWTRFWLLGTVPVARPAVTPDLARSAAARAIIEGVLWVPASLLPRNGVAWKPIDDDRARAIVEHRAERFALDLTVAEDGRPVSVAMQRWSNVNPEGIYRWQPFGGTIEEVRTFDGFRVPVRLHAGNHFGTDAYVPFFRPEILNVRYR